MLKEKVILIQCMLFYIYFITDYLSNIHFASSSSKATYIVEITVRKWMLIIFRWEHEIDRALEIDMRYNNFIQMSKSENIVIQSSEVGKKIYQNLSLKKILTPTIFHDLLLDDGRWNRYKIYELCPFITNWSIKGSLQARLNYEPQILKQIHHIKFDNLKILSLSQNRIMSIEGISRMWIPSLEKLQIHCNKILSIRQLKKISTPQLKQIKLYKNYILETIPMKYLNTQNLQVLKIDLFKSNKEMGMQIWWLLQLQTQFLRLINIEAGKRILQKNAVSCLKKKYKNIRIYHRK